MKEKIKILFVDDEPIVLKSLRRMLHPLRREWDFEFAESGREALKILSEKPFDLVVTDMRMPGMDGAQLLAEAKKRYPEGLRFVLSGQSEDEAFMRSIGSMHQFLSKPCEPSVLKSAVNRAFSLRDYLKGESLKKLMLRVESVPALPEVYCELMKELSSEDFSLENVGKMVSKDVGMTAKVLQVANSAFFGFSQRISTPAHAVQVLGLDMIQTLVLSHNIFTTFDTAKVKKFRLDRVWEHSLAVSGFAMAIARKEGMTTELENYAVTGGMLHDVGKLIMASTFPDKYQKIFSLVNDQGMDWLKAELEVFEVTHAEVGAYLIGFWGLPDPVVEAIAYHLLPSKCAEKSLTPLTLVHVANVFEQEFNEKTQQQRDSELDEEYLKEIGVHDRLPKWRAICEALGKEQKAHE